MISLESISPNYGPTEGGTAVTLTGAGFAEGMIATIGGMMLDDLIVVGSTTITGTTPSGLGNIGSFDVVVENPEIASSNAIPFCYTGTSAGWTCVRAFPGNNPTVLLSGDGQSVLVPYFDNIANEIVLNKSDDVGATFTSSSVAAPEGVTLDDASYKHFADSTLTTLLFPSGPQSLLSTDGGLTFSVVDHDAKGSNYAAGSSDGQVLILLMNGEGAAYSLVNLSIDGGDTWNVIDPDPDNHRFNSLTSGDISDDGQKIIVIGADGEGVNQATSIDGGTTWNYRDGLPVDFLLSSRVSMTRDGATVYVSGFNVIYQSDDFGANWTLLDAAGLLAISDDAVVQTYIPGGD